MRKRYQKGSVKAVDGKWIAQWREDGRKRKRTLGVVSKKMTKSDAERLLAEIVAPINARVQEPTGEMAFGLFVDAVYLPFYHRKWKRSTIGTNDDRVERYLVSEFRSRMLGSFRRDELQDFLDHRAAEGLSYSIVAHLRWDLRQIFRMAVAENFIVKNPADLLFVPRECPRPNTRDMNADQVTLMFAVLNLRELLIAKLAVVAGMRPGEIFALRWCRLEREYVDIRERVYRGQIDSPKTFHSIRHAALADGLRGTIEEWRAASGNPVPDAWVFPSEKGTTPIGTYNCWRRWIKPRLEKIGLGWVNFQVMRKTHSCIADGESIDPQVRADQMGHTVDVNQNVYTRSSLDRRIEAVNAIEKALVM
jgi:integrase